MREISAFRVQLHLLGEWSGVHGNNVIAIFEYRLVCFYVCSRVIFYLFIIGADKCLTCSI